MEENTKESNNSSIILPQSPHAYTEIDRTQIYVETQNILLLIWLTDRWKKGDRSLRPMA